MLQKWHFYMRVLSRHLTKIEAFIMLKRNGWNFKRYKVMYWKQYERNIKKNVTLK